MAEALKQQKPPQATCGCLLQQMAKLNFSEALTVLVADEKKPFLVHKDVIIPRSTFLRSACAERWSKPDSEKQIELPTDEPAIFSIYLQCLYTNSVVVAASSDADNVNTKKAECPFKNVLNTYFLADKLRDLTTCNLLIKELIAMSDKEDWLPSASDVNLVYDNTPESSPVRKLFVDYYIHECHRGESIKGGLTDGPKAFLLDLLEEEHRLKGQYRSLVVREVFEIKANRRPRCWYHQHDELHRGCEGDLG